jgi:tRNA A-37 threonylcarbamoyl transferase component Bud32
VSADPDDAADQGAAPGPQGVVVRTALTSSSSALSPIERMPSLGVLCPSCGQSNHAAVRRCAFCSAPIRASSTLVAARQFAEEDNDDDGASRVASGQSGASSEGRASIPSLDGDLSGAPIADPLIGIIIAERYRIREPLGRGGMGIVYKVEHTRIGKLLAMKLLTGELSRNPDVVRRFKQEALTVSKLESPNTVQVFDFGVSEGLTYLVMELVNGEDLGRTLRAEGPMPFARLGKIIIQVCSSLAEAHQKGIVHRDIKPENVMLLRGRDQPTDIAKVLDFGLAKLRENEGLNDVTSQGAIVGTPYYMAPEQIRGDAVDARADIYALGALMYRALTGHHPFSGPTPMAVFSKHLHEKPIPPGQRAPDLGIPDGMSALVLRALRKDAADRFQRIEELQALLIDEIRRSGSQGLDSLLDSAELRNLAAAGKGAAQPATAIATRDEVEAYERKLRRQRYGAVAGAAAIALGALGLGIKLLTLATRKADFRGSEIEPNNTAAEAMDLPLGQQVVGFLGKRLDATHGDRDFYEIELPESAPSERGHLRLQVSALPNLAMCSLIYKPGFADAVGRYCMGRPGRELYIPALELEAGRYFIAVLQDLDPYGAPAAPFIFENVSDFYTLRAESATPDPGSEIEPNDQVASATPLGLSLPCAAAIGWARDEDVFCIPEGTPGRIRWKVRDGLRDSGVLEATPLRGTTEGERVRIHLDARGKASDTDVVNPWFGALIAAEAGVQRCLRVRLSSDPWSAESAAVVPNGGNGQYVVEAEAFP